MDTCDYTLRSVTCSYYHEKRWIYGSLQIGVSGLTFLPQDPKLLGMRVLIGYNDIGIAKKTRTTIIFNAIYIAGRSKELFQEFWLSSFQDRDSTFNMILYFWKNLLTNVIVSTHNDSTNAGHELLSIVKDSETCLSAAAVTLAYQGDQIDGQLKTMDNIHHDLDISRRVLYGMEGWINKWSKHTAVNSSSLDVHRFKKNTKEFKSTNEITILYSPNGADCLQWYEGCFVFDDKGLSVMNENNGTVCHFDWVNVSKVSILSPWELIISQFLIGLPDLKCSIMGSQLVGVIKILNQRIFSKLDYCQPKNYEGNAMDSYKACGEILESPTTDFDSVQHFRETECTKQNTSATNSVSQQRKTLQTKPVISGSDIEELSSALSKIKSMATSLSEEQDRQIGSIYRLTSSVDTANIRMQEQQIFMKKL